MLLLLLLLRSRLLPAELQAPQQDLRLHCFPPLQQYLPLSLLLLSQQQVMLATPALLLQEALHVPPL
jgi:hypothetical protein